MPFRAISGQRCAIAHPSIPSMLSPPPDENKDRTKFADVESIHEILYMRSKMDLTRNILRRRRPAQRRRSVEWTHTGCRRPAGFRTRVHSSRHSRPRYTPVQMRRRPPADRSSPDASARVALPNGPEKMGRRGTDVSTWRPDPITDIRSTRRFPEADIPVDPVSLEIGHLKCHGRTMGKRRRGP
jgi:hypothetical protein